MFPPVRAERLCATIPGSRDAVTAVAFSPIPGSRRSLLHRLVRRQRERAQKLPVVPEIHP